MNTRNSRKAFLDFALLFILLTSCSPPLAQPTVAPVPAASPQANMPNPASVYCEEQGNRLEIRTAADGSQTGVCLFPDGSECDPGLSIGGKIQRWGKMIIAPLKAQ